MFYTLTKVTNDQEAERARALLATLHKSRSILENTALKKVVKCMIDKEIDTLDIRIDKVQSLVDTYLFKTQN